jgi:hypothetical protein
MRTETHASWRALALINSAAYQEKDRVSQEAAFEQKTNKFRSKLINGLSALEASDDVKASAPAMALVPFSATPYPRSPASSIRWDHANVCVDD